MENTNTKVLGLTDPKQLALHYMSVLLDIARESFLILDPDLRVVMANPIFFNTFQVTPKETEKKFVYELGNGQWNIPKLKNLLEAVLPMEKDVKNYEVEHDFQAIGERTMLLNARKLDEAQLIILAMEDITDRKALEHKLAAYTKGLEKEVALRTTELAERVQELESVNSSMVGRELKMVELKKEIDDLKKRLKNGKNGNGKHGNGNHHNHHGRHV